MVVKEKEDSELYEEWTVNTGNATIHAKRASGRFRSLKTKTSMIWLIFFLGPYLRWNGEQAILLDIPEGKFQIFSLTILPQDVWMLSLLLLFFAILLAVATALYSRVYCGFFCFQTVWTDLFTWIETKVEGAPNKRRVLDAAPWNVHKIKLRMIKSFFWLLIAVLTGISFVAWFTDVFDLWARLFIGDLGKVETTMITLLTAGTFFLAGVLREQACLWLCPYARLQAVMLDSQTTLPSYDENRGEPRGRLVKGKVGEGNGDCINCNQCVAVCPTGVDIRREAAAEACISCSLCIDACDTVMGKIGRPKGLIRYASLDELRGEKVVPSFKRPRVLVYASILIVSLGGIIYGMSNLSGLELKVLHERQPLYVTRSDGSLQNKYQLKVLNKNSQQSTVRVTVIDGDGVAKHLKLVGAEEPFAVARQDTTPHTVYLRLPREFAKQADYPFAVTFRIEDTQNPELSSTYESVFFGPGY